MNAIYEVRKACTGHEPKEYRAPQHSGFGILVLSRTMQVLHVNRRALELMGQIGRVGNKPIRVVLSPPVIELHATVEALLVAKVSQPFEVTRLIQEPGGTLRLRGFGLPDRHASEHSRIVIVLEEMRRRQTGRTEPAQALLQPAHRLAPVA
jgi:hypothetical protein